MSLFDAVQGPSLPHTNINPGVTGVNVTTRAGVLFGLTCYNANAAVRYLKFYDKATAPTQADTPVLVIGLEPSRNTYMQLPNGLAFLNGISYRVTTGFADNDTGAPTANQTILAAHYR